MLSNIISFFKVKYKLINIYTWTFFSSLLTTKTVADAANSTPDSTDCAFNSTREAVGYVCGTASNVIPRVLNPGYYTATNV